MELFPSLSKCIGNSPEAKLKGGCGWAELNPIITELLQNMILLGFFIATLMIFYAGYILVTKQGSADARTQVRKIFIGIVIGMILLVGAYYIVEFVLDSLGVSEEFRKDTII
jgi:type VI protein secretion system component VasK